MRGKPSFTASMKKVGSLGSIVNVKWYYLVEASRKSLQVACQEKTFQSLGWSASPKVERPFMKTFVVFLRLLWRWGHVMTFIVPSITSLTASCWPRGKLDREDKRQTGLPFWKKKKKTAEGVTDSKTKFKWWFKNCFVVQLPLEIVGSSCLSKALFPHL